MAPINSNTYYLVLTCSALSLSLNVSQYVVSAKIERKVGTTSTNAGNISHEQRLPTLKDTTLSGTIIYDSVSKATIQRILGSGELITADFGPENNGTGAPRHTQSFINESVGYEVNTGKDQWMFDFSLTGAATPTVDLFSGGVF